jgi:ribosome biogenesis GTPase
LSKKDLCEDADSKISELQTVTFGVPIIAVSSVTGEGVDQLRKYLVSGRTVAVLGSSGVGKSTLTNLLAGAEIMEIREIREDDSRGRHTTTFRNLVKLPDGGMIIDTTGMRELQLWESEHGLQGTFEDVEDLGRTCRFKDCNHVNEPGCAVREAIQKGLMPAARLESYAKLKKELRFIESKHNQSLRLTERKNAKNLSREIKKVNQVKQVY